MASLFKKVFKVVGLFCFVGFCFCYLLFNIKVILLTVLYAIKDLYFLQNNFELATWHNSVTPPFFFKIKEQLSRKIYLNIGTRRKSFL